MQKGRRSIRLKGYDYSKPGIYFITVYVKGGKHLFGKILNGKMALNLFGRIVQSKWKEIPKHFKNARLGEFQIMPNHFHCIIILTHHINDTNAWEKYFAKPAGISLKGHAPLAFPPASARTGEAFRAQSPAEHGDLCPECFTPLSSRHKPFRPTGTKPGSISAIMQNFASVTTRKINKIRKTPGHKMWQRGYYDVIITDKKHLHAVNRYIINNPINWPEKAKSFVYSNKNQ